MKDTITIDGIEYHRAADPSETQRAVVVVDRGWIFAGDVDESSRPGRIYLRNAVWVFKWASIGFDGVIEHPEKADIRPIHDVDIPAQSEIYRIPVPAGWGLNT